MYHAAIREERVGEQPLVQSKPEGASRLTGGDRSQELRASRHRDVLPALTPHGHAVARMPERLFGVLARWYRRHMGEGRPEEDVQSVVRSQSSELPSDLVRLESASLLAQVVLSRMQPVLEAWSGQRLVPEALYGVRVYREGAVLHRHVDHVDTHVVSAVLLIAQDVERPWPLVLEGEDGSRHEVVLEPGDALLYEGARMPHFRDVPLRGRSYAALFIHFRPVWWSTTETRVRDLARLQPLRTLAYGSADPVPPPTGTSARGYLAFQPDYGGWNNVLMQLEILVVLAWLTGRTLVLPPADRIYLLGKQSHDLGTFLDLEALRCHVPVVTADEFAEARGVPAFADYEAFSDWLQAHGHMPCWNALDDVLVHPPDALEQRPELGDRLLERRPIGIDAATAKAEVLYFPMTVEHRMFGVAETFFLLGDELVERRLRRLVRDALRYRPEIVALAERALRAPVLGRGFGAMHVRRGDFHRQYGETQINAERILAHTQAVFEPGQTLYLATDESDLSFFDALRTRFHVVTFEDVGVSADVEPHVTGIVETLICAAAPGPFVGTRLSTFSNRIATLRGYLATTPAGRAAGIDTALYYTQPPLDAAGEACRPYDVPTRRHEDVLGETAEPWWRSYPRMAFWARPYRSAWLDTDDASGEIDG
ncbi:MAG: O-fucosyltransferase family protein [Planctomycetota bacterium]|nr:O-fucosyltransferase family protein [Planctomycetota bacterium]